jgi:hypothetical protein
MDPPQVPAPKAKAKGKLGIKHLDLLYEARGKTMHVRTSPSLRLHRAFFQMLILFYFIRRTFPAMAAWAELLGHVQTEHADARAALETLSPGQIVE